MVEFGRMTFEARRWATLPGHAPGCWQIGIGYQRTDNKHHVRLGLGPFALGLIIWRGSHD